MIRVRGLAAAAAATIACACGGPQVMERSETSRMVRVMVEEGDLGLLDPAPAYAEAAEICTERMRRAVYVRGEDLGGHRLLHFRCE